jgi:pyruvate dehydrogenase E2 component (dihydrolipoamide acetyltransferase)
MTEFKIPELGENVAGGDVTRVLVNVGDTIAREQPILELETDKATIEVPSSVEGVITEVRVKKGDTIKVGAIVLTVDAPSSTNGGSAPTAQAAKPAPAAPDVPPMPPVQPSAPPRVLPMPVRQAAEPTPAPVPVSALPARADGRAAPASPAVRRLAREIGVNVNDIEGTGPGGRISLDDVKEHARRILSSIGAAGGVGPGSLARPGKTLPDFAKWGDVDRQPWSNIRRATSEHLSYAWNQIPHVTQFDKADVTALEELRTKHKEQVATAGGNLTVTAMLVRILAAAVHKFPQFNASIDIERGEIVF